MKTFTTLVLALLLTVGCGATGQVRADDDYFSQAELDSMLAPVALYPDSVLSHVLIAATYPLEVIQAARWSREHPGLRGEDAVAAVEYQNWDASVKALVAFPELLQRMDEDLQWTQDLGDAFLLQEEEVVASIQYLRSEAYSQGHLRSNDRVKVVREREYIYIEPARTRVVYVPYYDPRVIYSSWRWSSHPPRYWHRPSGFSLSVNFYWGRPYHIRPSFYFSSFHWPTRKVVVVNHHHYYREHRFTSGRQVARFDQARHWKHNPVHRRGVSYRGRVEQTRFVESSRAVAQGRKATLKREARREWAAEQRARSSFDRDTRSRTAAASRSQSRSDRIAESRQGNSRLESRAAARSRSDSRSATRSADRATIQSQRDRTVSGRAPARAESRSRASESTRSTSSSRASRLSESLRSGSSSRSTPSRSASRESITSRSRGSERASTRSDDRSSLRSIPERSSRSGVSSSPRSSADRSSRSSRSERSSVAIPRGLSTRSGSSRERSSAPSRSSGSRASAPSRGSVIRRDSAPSRQSAPSRSRSSVRESAPSRSAPRSRASAPSRSSKSAPSRSRSTSPRSSSRSRSRDGGGSGRDGERR
jgi:hypothetical protein